MQMIPKTPMMSSKWILETLFGTMRSQRKGKKKRLDLLRMIPVREIGDREQVKQEIE